MTSTVAGDILTPAHRRQLEHDSAILPEVLAEEDISSLESSLELPTPDAALRHPNSHKGQYFGQWGEMDARFRPIDLGPGIWFDTRDVAGRRSGQYKPDAPRTAFNGHVVKYEHCRGTRPSFAVPRRCLTGLVETMAEVFFTEGYKKALALASAGACAISLAGVDAWLVKPEPNAPSEPVEDFDAVRWHGRIVWIVYDSDAVLKDGVQWAERRLRKELESRGAIVVVLRVPHAPDGSKQGVDDHISSRLAAGISRADAVSELKGPALAALIGRAEAKRPEPPTGGDGEETCRNCAPLAEQLREHKLADQARRQRAFSAGEVEVARYYARQAAVAISQGKEKASVWGEETQRLTGQSPSTATRLHKVWRALQDDPAIGPTLPFRIETEVRGGKEHIEVVPPAAPAARTTVAMLETIAQLRRPGDRGSHGGERVTCPKHPEAPIQRTRIWRCTEDDCSWVHQDTALLGATVPESEPVRIGDDLYAVEVQGTTPFHDEMKDLRTYHEHDEMVPTQPFHDETAPLIPVSFAIRDDLTLFAAPHYLGEASPEPPPPPPVWTPPPLAPSSHVARAFKRVPPPVERLPVVAGGEE